MKRRLPAILALLALLLLGACGQETTPAVTVEGPALIMFYTDG